MSLALAGWKTGLVVQRAMVGVLVAFLLLGWMATGLNAQPRAPIELIQPPPLVTTFHAAQIAGPGVLVVPDEQAWQGQAAVLTPGGAGLSFDAMLKPSHYVVHVICRIEGRQTRHVAPPMILTLRVTRLGNMAGSHDAAVAQELAASAQVAQPEAGTQWRTRVTTLLTYHDTGHLYFEVDQPGTYRVEIVSHKRSRGRLLVEHVDLRDVFGSLPGQGFKTSQNLLTPEQLKAVRSLPASRKLTQTVNSTQRIAGLHRLEGESLLAWRKATFDVVWGIVPPANLHFANPRTEAHLQRWISDEAYDYQGVRQWEWSRGLKPRAFERKHFILPADPGEHTLARMALGPWEFRHPRNAQTYGQREFFAGKIAGDAATPDDGTGFFLAARIVGGATPLQVNWLAGELMQQYRDLARLAITRAKTYEQTGNEIIGWEALCAMIAFAQRYPDIDYQTQRFDFTPAPFTDGLNVNTYPYGKFSHSAGERWVIQMIVAYDQLFPLIENNQQLADLVGQHVAWVKTPADVIKLLDMHLLQHVRDCVDRQVIRGNDGSIEELLATAAVVQGVNEAGDWIWKLPLERSFFRSDVQGGLAQQWISNFNADGTWHYGTLSNALNMPATNSRVVSLARRYVEMGGKLPAELADGSQFLALSAAGQTALNMFAADGFMPRIGNTGSPLEGQDNIARILAGSGAIFENAWRDSQQPAMAWQLAQATRSDQDDETWKGIVAAAAAIKRPPWETSSSRQLPGVGMTVLQTPPVPSDGDADRQAVVLRTGAAYGASHADTLGLSMYAHRLRVVPDPGRNDRIAPLATNRVHFLVEVDEKDFQANPSRGGIGWTSNLSPMHDVTFTAAAAWADSHPQVKRYQRRVALIPIGQNQAYTLDVFDVQGGSVHTWTSPGPPADDAGQVSFNVDMSDRQTELLKRYPGGEGYGTLRQGTAGDLLQVNWQASPDHVRRGQRTPRNETPVRVDFRAWLMGAQGQPVIHAFGSPGESDPKRLPFNFVHVRRKGSSADARSTFTAILETYTQEKPVVQQVTPVNVSSPDARAIRVETTAGRLDHLLVTSSESNAGEVNLASDIQAAGEFALVSTDNGRVTQLAVSRGSKAAGPGVSLQPATREHVATITQVNLHDNTLTLDKPLPDSAALQGQSFALIRDGKPYDISMTIASARGDVLTPAQPLKIYQTDLWLFDEAAGTYAPGMTPVLARAAHDYYNGLAMFNEEGAAVGRAHVSQGDRWMYLGYPQYWQWKQRLTSADMSASSSKPVTFNLIANSRVHRVESTADGQTQTYPIMPGEKMTSLTVTRVREDGLMFWFKDPATIFADDSLQPNDSTPYAGQKLVTPDGRELVATAPGTQWLVKAMQGRLSESQLPDANNDGRREISVSQAAVGDRISLPTYASAVRLDDGRWSVKANVAVTFTLENQSITLPLSDTLVNQGVVVIRSDRGLMVENGPVSE